MDDDQLTGQTLAQYKIEDKLGQGGMGAVFRAWDTNLRRWVAIKMLRAGADQNAEKRARFLMEARSAAALNHPNIVTIYEIGQSNQMDFIAMEFVPGRTLHQIVHSGQLLTLDEVLKYASQIADALSAAHAAGITHRDLKPANIMVSANGRLKVLDFGIAKRLEAEEVDENTRTMAVQTLHGLAVGTPNYMSPEQAQGKLVDGRSDIFAIGAIIYEMLTGHRAFGGDSMAAIMAAILTQDPPPVSTFRAVPEELDRLVARCLRKDVERRLQHAGDLKIALDEIRGEHGTSPTYSSSAWLAAAPAPGPSSGTPPRTAGSPSGVTAQPAYRFPTSSPSAVPGMSGTIPIPIPSKSRWKFVWYGLGALLLAGAGVLSWFHFREPAANPFAGATLRRITADSGLSVWPALSRDGKFVVYASDRPDEKNLHLWVQQLGGGQPIQLTYGDADDTEPSFSPDGTKIVFHSDRDGGGVYIIPTLGGEARLLALHGRRPRFSPDGTKIVYMVGNDLGKIYLIDAAEGASPQPFQTEFQLAQDPIWSPDGKSILFDGTLPEDNSKNKVASKDWYIAPVGGGRAVPTGIYPRLRSLQMMADGPSAWLAGDQLVYSGKDKEGITSLWSVRFSPNSSNAAIVPQRLTFGTSLDNHPAAAESHAGPAPIAFSSISKRIDLWMLPVDANKGRVTGQTIRLTQGGGTESTQLTISRDGKRIAYFSDRDGKAQPWIRDLSTGRQATIASPGVMWFPSLSPDGRTLAWSVFENRRPEKTYRASIGPEGQLGLTELLCEKCGQIVSWTPDGRTVIYSKGNPTSAAVLELDTGKRYDLLLKPGADVWGGRISPDGRWVTMNLTPTPTQSQVYIAPFDPERRAPIPFAEWIPVTDGTAWDDKSRWSPDSNSMYFVSERDGFRCIWWQQLNPATHRPSGVPVAVMHFHQARLSLRNVDMGPLAFQVGPDKMIFSLGELTGNIWMLNPNAK